VITDALFNKSHSDNESSNIYALKVIQQKMTGFKDQKEYARFSVISALARTREIVSVFKNCCMN
jgi:hypothetical protein